MKTYKITKESEFVVDKGSHYLLTRFQWDGNLDIDLDKTLIVDKDGHIDTRGGRIDTNGGTIYTRGGHINTRGGYIKVKYIFQCFFCKRNFKIAKETCIIGCKEKTWDEWDAWFASDEEYDTKRGTQEFDLIQKSYEAAKVMKDVFFIFDKYNKE